MKPVVFIHTNDQNLLGALVGAHSLRSRSSHADEFEVRLLRLEETPHLQKRFNQRLCWWEGDIPIRFLERDHLSFCPLRRFVPQLMDFTGRALVIDPDIVAVGDVFELISRDMQGKAILCRQREYARRTGVKTAYSGAVMLLDCAKLTHWQWEREIDDVFEFKLNMGSLLQLEYENKSNIGIIEDEWNHCDTLNRKTKLLHYTETTTQPWRTGVKAMYGDHVQPSSSLRERLRRFKRRLLRQQSTVVGLAHPDPRQEHYFFSLLSECLDNGSVSESFLRRCIRNNDLRPDVFELLSRIKTQSKTTPPLLAVAPPHGVLARSGD